MRNDPVDHGKRIGRHDDARDVDGVSTPQSMAIQQDGTQQSRPLWSTLGYWETFCEWFKLPH
jgi:hypothetical protein